MRAIRQEEEGMQQSSITAPEELRRETLRSESLRAVTVLWLERISCSSTWPLLRPRKSFLEAESIAMLVILGFAEGLLGDFAWERERTEEG